jgi:hypothetical protein
VSAVIGQSRNISLERIRVGDVFERADGSRVKVTGAPLFGRVNVQVVGTLRFGGALTKSLRRLKRVTP